MGLGEEGEGFRIHHLPSSSLVKTVGPLTLLLAEVDREGPSLLLSELGRMGRVFVRHRCKGHYPYGSIKLPGQLSSYLSHQPKPHTVPPTPMLGSLLQDVLGTGSPLPLEAPPPLCPLLLF